MKVSASRLRKSPIKCKGYISTEDLLRSVAEEQKSMLEELGRTLQIMRDVLASLDATRVSVERFGGSSCPPCKM
jgi:predicted metal-dependent RNase